MRVVLLYDGTENEERAYIEIFKFYCNEHNIEFLHDQIYNTYKLNFREDDIVFFDMGALAYRGLGNNFSVMRNTLYLIRRIYKKVKKIYLITKENLMRYALEDDFLKQFDKFFEYVDLSKYNFGKFIE